MLCIYEHVLDRRLMQYLRIGPQTVVIFVVVEKLRSLSGLGSSSASVMLPDEGSQRRRCLVR